jgi:hypothetical protein
MSNLEKAIQTFNAVVEAVESRCLAADGPVTPTLREMREDELSKLWLAVQAIRQETANLACGDDATEYEVIKNRPGRTKRSYVAAHVFARGPKDAINQALANGVRGSFQCVRKQKGTQ